MKTNDRLNRFTQTALDTLAGLGISARVVCRNGFPFTPRQAWQASYRQQRKAASRETKQWARSLRGAMLAARANVAKLASEIRVDIAPALRAIRERDDFINSGRSLYAEAHRVESAANTSRKLAKPPLPYVGKLPPNK